MYNDILQFIHAYQNFFLVGHKEPDGDCVGSQLALGQFLRRLGKTATPVSIGPFAKTEITHYEDQFQKQLPEVWPESSALIVMDCSSWNRTGFEDSALPAALPLAYIDHHRAPAPAASALCINPSLPAVTCLVQGIIEASGSTAQKEEAELLLFGLCTDTGFFRHLDGASAEVFAQVSRLVAAGASPKTSFYMMNGGKSVASRQLMGLALQRLEAHYDGRLLFTWMDLEDQKKYGLAGRDSDMLYQLLMTIEGMEAVVVIRQESETACTVGFRSLDRVDVAAIAATFGGGGHRLAAGLFIEEQPARLRERILEAFRPLFS